MYEKDVNDDGNDFLDVVANDDGDENDYNDGHDRGDDEMKMIM